jgi:hypothetical protein
MFFLKDLLIDSLSYSHRTFDPEFDDFFITSIDNFNQTATEFWGILLNYQFTAVGGCQQEVTEGQDVLWAFNAFNAEFFLKLTGPYIARIGEPVTVNVTDGATGLDVEGAVVNGVSTNADGQATITFHEFGEHVLKAEKINAIRSNALYLFVY